MDRRFVGGGIALFLSGILIGWMLSGSDEELQTELAAARNQEVRLAALSEDVDTMSARLEEIATTANARDYDGRFGAISEELAAVNERLEEIAAATAQFVREAGEMRKGLDVIANETTTRFDEIAIATERFDEIAAGVGERLDAVAMELARQHDALAQRTASLEQIQQEQFETFTARIDQIGSSLDGLGQRLAGELVTPDPAAWNTLARQLKEMHDTVAQIGGRGSAGGTEQVDADEETPAGGYAGASSQNRAEAANQAPQGAKATAGSTEPAAGGASGSNGTELRVGQTTSFEDGAVRIFLSAAMPDTQTARVAINGFTMSTLEIGVPAAIKDCDVELTDVRQDTATLAVRCPASGRQQGEAPIQAPRPELVRN